MPSIFSTALTGLLLLPSATTTNLTAQPWTKTAPVEPTYLEERYSVSMTGYNAVPEQTKPDPSFNASGLPVNPEIDAARSRDLADELPFGTVIELVPGAATSTPSCELAAVDESIGLRVITDTMNLRMHNHVDILFAKNDIIKIGGRRLNSARAMGMCTGIEIRVVGHVDMRNVPETQAELRAAVGRTTLALAR